MLRSRYLIVKIIFLSLFFLPSFSYAIETLSNTGLMQSNIWYSKDPFYAGDKVRIYTVIFNGSSKDLRGRVNFYNNKNLLCNTSFTSLAGRVSEVWCDWFAIAGKNSISVKIVNTKASVAGEDEKDVVLSNSDLAVSERVVKVAPASKSSVVAKEIEDKKTTVLNQAKEVINKAIDTFRPNTEEGNRVIPEEKISTTTSKLSAGLNSLTQGAATAYPAIIAVKDRFYSFTASIADWVLPKIKAWTETDNKPLATVAGFFYSFAKFIFDSPAIFASIIIAVIWKILEKILRRREEY